MMSNTFRQEKKKTQPIRVYIRLRPLNKQELEVRSSTCVEISNAKDLLVKQQYGKHYTFDKVFGPDTTQMDIYNSIVKPLIPDVLAGYNCTIFAYGQTGTGKTYTMTGESKTIGMSLEGDEQAGIIPRAMAHLFDELSSIPRQYTVHASFLEIYNEELFDLLSDKTENKSIRLFEDQHQKGSVIINGISTVMLCNKSQIYEILQKGQEKRQTSSTLLNDRSSRSHAVFSITIHTCETNVEGEELVKTAKLNLVDLAGSEHFSKPKSSDRRIREAGSVNQSLLILQRVIKSLAVKSVHIPYRESKLTRILQDSLGGRTKTSMIATISLANSCLEETLSTLDYAHRAKCIINRPEVNQRVSQKAWKAEYEKEMDRLRKDLHAARTSTGIYLDQDNYQRLISDKEIRKEELSEKMALISELEEKLQQMEEEKNIKEMEWNTIQRSLQEINKGFVKCCKMFRQDEELEEQLPIDCEAKVEHLQKQAKYLLEMTATAAKSFHIKIHSLLAVNEENNNSLRLVSETVSTKCQEIIDLLVDFMINIRDTSEHIIDIVGDVHKRQTQQCRITDGYGNNILWETENIVNAASQSLENAVQHDYLQKKKFLEEIETKLKEVTNMTKWVDVKINLESTRETLLMELNKTRENSNRQHKITNKIMNELETIGKGMLEMQNSIKIMKDRVHGLENSVRNLTNMNNECWRDINKVQTSVEQSLLGICDKIQNNMDYRSALLAETMDSVNKGNNQDVAVVEVLEQLKRCKQNFPQIREQIEINSDSLMEAHVQNLVDITNAHLKTNNEMFDEYTTYNSNIQKHLKELNDNASGNELVIHSTLQNCQKNLIDFMNNGIIDIKSSDNIPIRLQPQINRKTQTSSSGDRNSNDYIPLQNSGKQFENKLSSSTVSSACSGTNKTDPTGEDKSRSHTFRYFQNNRCIKEMK
ncbi:hypothetical protein ILUMI_26728 [Ignelater luminosus]|uniref:Kinesin-like protein n=1 Tax=Ignelater luminosus TaxID=2038154 RepID=A0A8K0FYN3_IGNLU|nr:hypothetical protein ILUMI_26728 [Ignelater luminosus]